MKLTKLLNDSVAIQDVDSYAVLKSDPLRLIKITAKQYNICVGVLALLKDLRNGI